MANHARKLASAFSRQIAFDPSGKPIIRGSGVLIEHVKDRLAKGIYPLDHDDAYVARAYDPHYISTRIYPRCRHCGSDVRIRYRMRYRRALCCLSSITTGRPLFLRNALYSRRSGQCDFFKIRFSRQMLFPKIWAGDYLGRETKSDDKIFGPESKTTNIVFHFIKLNILCVYYYVALLFILPIWSVYSTYRLRKRKNDEKRRAELRDSEEKSKERSRLEFFEAASDGNLEKLRNIQKIEPQWSYRERDGGGSWTALHLAAYRGHKDVVEYLLRNRAPINYHLNPELLLTGLAGVDRIFAQPQASGFEHRGWTALHLAAFKGHEEIVRLLLTTRQIDGKTLRSAKSVIGYYATRKINFGFADYENMLKLLGE